MMRDKKILWITITVYVLVMAGSSFWKYQEMRYNAIDLAYYNQVFWKTIHGDFFGLTIHPHISLGDHVEPVIVFLAPFYALWPDARMLLLLQSLALALAALPIYSLASLLIGRKKVMHHNAAQSGAQKNLPLFLSLLWLLNPLTQNANLFEFHTLPFALLPLFYAIIAYEERKIGRFILWSLLALTVREDVALVIAAFALLAFIDVIKRRGVAPEGIPSRPEATGTHPRRVEGDGVAEDGKVRRRQDPEHLSTGPRALIDRTPSRWIFAPLLLGLSWFFIAQKIAGHFASDGAYKFLTYYSWLGNSFPEIFFNLLRHPSTVLTHIATKNTGLLFLALGIPFLFLPLARPRYLLLILPILLQNLLTSYGGTPLIAETHYVTLLLPGLFLAMIAALLHPPRFIAVFPLRLLLIVATLYSMSTLGPLYGVITERTPRDTLQSRDFFISQIPLNASLATTESFLTQLSRREKLYLLRYAIAGKTQFDKTPYRLPENIQYILLDADDVLSYAQDAEAMRDTFAPFKIIAAEKSFFLLTRGTGISLLQPNKQKTPDATIAREVPCSLPPLAACTRLAINTDSKEGNAIMVNDDPNNLFPSFFASYWLPDDAINDIAIGTATTTTALTRDRGTRYVREFNDERNLAISQQ